MEKVNYEESLKRYQMHKKSWIGLDKRVNDIIEIDGREYITYKSLETGKVTILGKQPPLNLSPYGSFSTSQNIEAKNLYKQISDHFNVDTYEVERIINENMGVTNKFGEKININRFYESFMFCKEENKRNIGYFISSLNFDMSRYRQRIFKGK